MTNSSSRTRLDMTIMSDQAGLEIKSILKNELNFSAARLRSVKFDPEGILLDGQRVTVRKRVEEGQILSILISDSLNRKEVLVPVEMPLEILYEDENLLFINKPAGMVCHPSQGHYFDSLANGVRAYLDEHKGGSVHLAGRLDKETSGVVCVAKNGVTAERLRLFKESSGFRKTYIAAAEGAFLEDSGVITTPMEEAEGSDGLLRMVISESGKPSETRWEVLERRADYTLLKVMIGTGRMHQIRFHMSSVGHPLLGDPLYGHESVYIKRTALHAAAMEITHPFSSEWLRIEATLPEDMASLF